MSIRDMMDEAVAEPLTEETGMTVAAGGPVMATPAAFAGAGAYALATLQAYDMGREHAGANS